MITGILGGALGFGIVIFGTIIYLLIEKIIKSNWYKRFVQNIINIDSMILEEIYK